MVDLRYRLGVLFEEELQSPDRAVEKLSSGAWRRQRTRAVDFGARTLFGRCGPARDGGGVLADLRKRGAWMKLIRTHEIHLYAADDSEKRIEFTKAIAALYEEKVLDVGQAFGWYGKVFVLQPATVGRAISWRGSPDKFRRGKVLRICISAISTSRVATTNRRRSMCCTAAEIYDQRLGDVSRAQECYRRLLVVSSEDMAAFRPFEAMLRRSERWNDLYSVYRDAIRDTLDLDRKKRCCSKYRRCKSRSSTIRMRRLAPSARFSIRQ